jgi:cytochrome c oxidase subunit 3
MSLVQPARTPLPRMAVGHGETVWWGMIFLVMIESVVFASLVMTYFYLRAGAGGWPPPGIERPDLWLPTVDTLVLLASVVPVMWADRAVRRGQVRTAVLGKLVGQALLVVFLVLKVVEYGGYDYDWSTHAYGSIVWRSPPGSTSRTSSQR